MRVEAPTAAIGAGKAIGRLPSSVCKCSPSRSVAATRDLTTIPRCIIPAPLCRDALHQQIELTQCVTHTTQAKVLLAVPSDAGAEFAVGESEAHHFC